MYWNHGDSNNKHLTIKNYPFVWVVEDHNVDITFGKVIAKLEQHDFLVLDTNQKYLQISLMKDGITQEMLVESVYFASFNIILDGFYHHLRSRVLENSNLGLPAWLNRQVEENVDFYVSLRNHYRNLGYMRDVDVKIKRIVDILRIWMLTGVVLQYLILDVKDAFFNHRRADMFFSMFDSMLSKGVPSSIAIEYDMIGWKI